MLVCAGDLVYMCFVHCQVSSHIMADCDGGEKMRFDGDFADYAGAIVIGVMFIVLVALA